MAAIAVMLVVVAVLVVMPAWMLGLEYNLAVGVGYCAMGLVLYSIFLGVQDVKDELRILNRDRKGAE